MRIFIIIVTFYIFSFIKAIAASDPLTHGEVLAKACIACHGSQGQGLNPQWPKLAGQNIKYFITQMNAFKKGKEGGRFNAIMQGLVANLSAQDIHDLAVYFAAQKSTYGTTDLKYLASGKLIYMGGIRHKNIPACSACHGPDGMGNAPAGFPLLSGQYTLSTIKALYDYKNGERTKTLNDIMPMIASRMSDDEMQAVANYIEGLHPRS